MIADEPALARAVAMFIRYCPIRAGDPVDVVVAHAEAHWRRIAASVGMAPGGFEPAFEVAWLLLDEAGVAPREAHDEEEAELVERLRLFMALAPDRDAWLRYLEAFPAGGRFEAWRSRRATRARLLYGAVHPDSASLGAGLGPASSFVRGHLDGPVICLECRRARGEPVRVAAAGADALLDVRASVEARDGHRVDIAVRAIDDEGWLRVRIDPIDPARPIDGRWQLGLHVDDRVYRATLDLEASGWHGHNLGRLHASGPSLEIQRVELAREDDPR